jgi:SAM-dependent methyltransferase
MKWAGQQVKEFGDILRKWFVGSIYATHNDSRSVRETLSKIMSTDVRIGANVGSGGTFLGRNIINVEIGWPLGRGCRADARALPFRDGSLDLILFQEVLEHVRRPLKSLREAHRALRPGGLLYVQLPFVIGYHPGPFDFWRFSREGIRAIVEDAGFEVDSLKISVGPGTGAYRILVEFVAIAASVVLPRLYRPAKGVAALLLFPVKLLDPMLSRSREADRIAGGYLLVGRKLLANGNGSDSAGQRLGLRGEVALP